MVEEEGGELLLLRVGELHSIVGAIRYVIGWLITYIYWERYKIVALVLAIVFALCMLNIGHQIPNHNE